MREASDLLAEWSRVLQYQSGAVRESGALLSKLEALLPGGEPTTTAGLTSLQPFSDALAVAQKTHELTQRGAIAESDVDGVLGETASAVDAALVAVSDSAQERGAARDILRQAKRRDLDHLPEVGALEELLLDASLDVWAVKHLRTTKNSQNLRARN